MASAAIRRCFRSSAAGSATGTGRLACGRKKKSRRLTAMRACHSKVVVRTIALRVRGAWGATVHTSLRGKLLGGKDGTSHNVS